MKIACVVLASGKNQRFDKKKSKLFYKVYGTPIIEYTLKSITKFINTNSIYITIPKKITKKNISILGKYTTNQLIPGGKDRYNSLRNAILNVDRKKYKYVMIHDAARPLLSKKLIINLLAEAKLNTYDCIIPTSVVSDTLRRNNITVNRAKYTYSQTPQIINLEKIINSINKIKTIPTDDYGIVERNKNLKTKFIQCDKKNIKITNKEDISLFRKIVSSNFRIGNGFDIHKLKKGEFLSLGGLKIKSNLMAVGHSDGDVVLHSIIDSILGATNKGDIGEYFPALKKYKDISSHLLLEEIIKKVKLNDFFIEHIDCTIICQSIRLSKYKNCIKVKLAHLLNCNKSQISIKAKTSDNVGLIGKSKAIACWTSIKLIYI